jgi:hypothetical protein
MGKQIVVNRNATLNLDLNCRHTSSELQFCVPEFQQGVPELGFGLPEL